MAGYINDIEYRHQHDSKNTFKVKKLLLDYQGS